MSEKDIEYRLTVDPLNMEKGFKSAEQSARAFERELARLEAQDKRVHDAMNTTGKVALGMGAALAAGLVVASRAAIDWQSAWTGVVKVVEGTPEQMAALEQQIRGLTRVLPVAHEEIAAVAAAAGQLGVRREDIAQFAKTMVMMGTATNLASDEAATALARMMNIMQTAPSNVDRLGSAIVGLGNNFATTESEIVAMALRISGAGHTIKMSEADVLGYAAALSSVGIEAEAGGTAISSAFIKIETAVRGGGDKLETFARVAGMTSQEFVRAYQQDAARAIASFVQGLGNISASGGDVFAVLDSVNLSEIRMRDAMLRLSGAGDILTTALDISNQSWDENRALLEEAERRYGTTEAKMQLARNSVNDLAIDIGQFLLPVIGKSADSVRALGQFLGDLPGPVQAALVIVAALSAALLVAGGTALLAVPKIAAYKAAIDALANSTGRLAAITVAANGALGRVGMFLRGPWGVALGLAVAAVTAFGIAQGEAGASADELSRTLDEQTGAITDATRAWIAHELEQRGVLKAAQEMGIDLADLVDAILSGADATQMAADANHRLGKSMQDPDWDETINRSSRLVNGIEDMQGALALAQAEFQRTNEAVHGSGAEIDRLDPKTRDLAEGLGLTADQAKDLTGELKDLDDELKAVFDSIFGLSNAQDDLQDAVDALTEGIRRQRQANDEGAGAFTGNSKAARENRDALQQVLEAQAALVLQTIEQTGSTEDAYQAMDDFKTMMGHVADQLGIDVTQVDGYNEAVDAIERRVEVKFGADTRAAKAAVEDYIRKLKQVPARIITQFEGRPTRSSGPIGYAVGGPVGGPPGVDNVHIMATPGEYIMRASVARENRAVLDALNAGARFPIYGAGSGLAGGGPSTVHNEWNIYPQQALFGPAELQLVMAQHEAKERVGRPR